MVLLFMVVIPLSIFATPAEEAVKALIGRQLGEEAISHFELKILESEKDQFKLASVDGKIYIEGNAGYSLASGFHHYVKKYLKGFVGQLETQITLPNTFPLPTEETVTSLFQIRNAYNYCTFSYTMAFWSWEDWEKEIDLLAMYGVNQPLMIVGLEKVWQEFLKEVGYTQKDIEAFIPTTAYTAWWLMANLEGTGGPVPQKIIDHEYELALKILERMRSFEMTPISQSFFGMVPSTFRNYYPKAKIKNQGKWGGFKRPEILLPTDKLFPQMAEIWYKHLHNFYGDFKYYAGDLFHEGGSTAGVNLRLSAKSVEKAMQKASPDAIYSLQAWHSNPQPRFVRGLTHENVIVQKLQYDMSVQSGIYADNDRGKPWTLNLINNFGGGQGLYGNLKTISMLPDLLQMSQNEGCVGLGYLCEGTMTNPVFYDLLSEVFWSNEAVDLPSWLNDYVIRRYQLQNADTTIVSQIQEAWNLLATSIYNVDQPKTEGQTDSVIAARPASDAIKARSWSSGKQYWNTEAVEKAANLLLSGAQKLGPNLQSNLAHDLTDIFRQVLQTEAFNNSKNEVKFLQIIADTESLMAANKDFLLGNWIAKARAKGAFEGKEAEELYEISARQLITRWDEPGLVWSGIKDYSNRTWSGLIGDYYAQRWNYFFENKNSYDTNAYIQGIETLENNWIYNDNTVYSTIPKGDTLTICKDLALKYFQ